MHICSVSYSGLGSKRTSLYIYMQIPNLLLSLTLLLLLPYRDPAILQRYIHIYIDRIHIYSYTVYTYYTPHAYTYYLYTSLTQTHTCIHIIFYTYLLYSTHYYTPYTCTLYIHHIHVHYTYIGQSPYAVPYPYQITPQQFRSKHTLARLA